LIGNRTAGKTSYRQIERTPEEVHLAALSQKTGSEFFQCPVGRNQYPAKSFDVFDIIRRVMVVFVIRRRVIELGRSAVDADFYSQ
jgi:hypothetical protein